MMMNSLSVNTCLLPTGGLSRCRCSSIQRLKLKALSSRRWLAHGRNGMRWGARDVTLSTIARAVAGRRQPGKACGRGAPCYGCGPLTVRGVAFREIPPCVRPVADRRPAAWRLTACSSIYAEDLALLQEAQAGPGSRQRAQPGERRRLGGEFPAVLEAQHAGHRPVRRERHRAVSRRACPKRPPGRCASRCACVRAASGRSRSRAKNATCCR